MTKIEIRFGDVSVSVETLIPQEAAKLLQNAINQLAKIADLIDEHVDFQAPTLGFTVGMKVKTADGRSGTIVEIEGENAVIDFGDGQKNIFIPLSQLTPE